MSEDTKPEPKGQAGHSLGLDSSEDEARQTQAHAGKVITQAQPRSEKQERSGSTPMGDDSSSANRSGPIGALLDSKSQQEVFPDPAEWANFDTVERTDMGYAMLFAGYIRGKILWCERWKKWLVWDGRRWVKDKTLRIINLAKNINRLLIVHANMGPEEMRQQRVGFVLKYQSAAKTKAMLTWAASQLAIDIDSLDRDHGF